MTTPVLSMLLQAPVKHSVMVVSAHKNVSLTVVLTNVLPHVSRWQMVGHARQNAYPTQNHAEVTVQEDKS